MVHGYGLHTAIGFFPLLASRGFLPLALTLSLTLLTFALTSPLALATVLITLKLVLVLVLMLVLILVLGGLSTASLAAFALTLSECIASVNTYG